VLQHELDGIAWASFAGGATFSLATLPIAGGAGTAWTSGPAGFTSDVQKLAAQSAKNGSVLIAISGQVSPRLRQELGTRGFTVHDRLAPGPLK